QCKYNAGPWGECNADTNTQQRERSLKRGGGDCPPVQVQERPCRGQRGTCKYKRGTWSICDPVSNKKTMLMTLKTGGSQCPQTKTREKDCKRQKKSSKGCVYKKGRWGECDQTTNVKVMVKTLKRGDPNTCQPTMTVEKICKRKHQGLKSNCKYIKASKWGKCDPKTGLKSREMVLKKGRCQPRINETRPCGNKKKKKEENQNGCKYDKSAWRPCEAASNTVSRTLTLIEGDPSVCNATKVQTKKCKDRHLRPHLCKYRRTSWGECDVTTNMRQMVKTLKRGDPAKCEPTQTIEKKCKSKKNNVNVCQYKMEPWSGCDLTTNTITRRQVLTSGPATCLPVKQYSRNCKKQCRFESGEWSACDKETYQTTRVDRLRPGSLATCPSARVLSKKCGKGEKKCVYGTGTWSECDTTENPMRTRTQILISGGSNCKQEKITKKSCKKKNGQVRCFYGPWGEFDACKNGVQKKIRHVIQGGLECELKSVKMKAC
ncbi:hypothetical protein DPMN_042771, partial [Dreissena polymorpha]